jgi:hypothetical protein
MPTHDEILKQFNRSGYGFQLRVEHEVNDTFQEHGWTVASREQPWAVPDGASGFIDLVLTHHHFTTCRLVVECKRIRADDARQLNWLFLLPGDTAQETVVSSCLKIEGNGDRTKSLPQWHDVRIWEDVRISPASYQSEFCVMPSDEPRRTPILESLAVDCLQSVEGLGIEEVNVMSRGYAQHLRLFIVPVVVTNAALTICRFDPAAIAIEDGTLSTADALTETVPFIRFRKSLTTGVPERQFRDIAAANRARERTVFVVTAAHLSTFLKGWGIDPLDRFNEFAIQRRQI